MERKIQERNELFKPVKLYRDDIDDILQVLKEVSSNVTLSTDEYIFQDVNEWAGLPKAHFTNLSIASTKPYISRNCSGTLGIQRSLVQSR